ncbi:MAG: hypothetical protein HY271_04880 [Deltaproteobacteria bacterium]|nr:hypothetical protein [Deltaproteobacteria bacterium]
MNDLAALRARVEKAERQARPKFERAIAQGQATIAAGKAGLKGLDDAKRQLAGLEEVAATATTPAASPRAPETPDEAFTAWGQAAVMRAWRATPRLLHVVEDLFVWERALRPHTDAAATLAAIAVRTGVALPALLDLMHGFRLNVRFADATRPFLERGAAKRLAKAPAALDAAVRIVHEWRALWPVLFGDYLQRAAADVIEGRSLREMQAKGEKAGRGGKRRGSKCLLGTLKTTKALGVNETTDGPDPVDRLVLHMGWTGQLIETFNPETGAHRIVTAFPTEVARIDIVLAALARLARFNVRAAHLLDKRLLLPKRRGRKAEHVHLLACIRQYLETPLASRTGGALAKNDLAMLAALALPEPEARGSWLTSKGTMTPGDHLNQLEKREKAARTRAERAVEECTAKPTIRERRRRPKHQRRRKSPNRAT